MMTARSRRRQDPLTFEENVEVTRKVVDYAHERGIAVMREIGVLAH